MQRDKVTNQPTLSTSPPLVHSTRVACKLTQVSELRMNRERMDGRRMWRWNLKPIPPLLLYARRRAEMDVKAENMNSKDHKLDHSHRASKLSKLASALLVHNVNGTLDAAVGFQGWRFSNVRTNVYQPSCARCRCRSPQGITQVESRGLSAERR